MADEDLMALIEAQGQPNLSFGRSLNPFAQLLIGAAQGLAMPARGGYGRLGPALGQGLATGLGAYEQALEAQRKHAEDLAQLQIEIAKSQQAGRIAQQKDITTRRGQDLADTREWARQSIDWAKEARESTQGEERIGIETRKAGAAEKSATASAQRAATEFDKATWDKQRYNPNDGPPFVFLQDDPPEVKHAAHKLNRQALDRVKGMTMGEVKKWQEELDKLRTSYLGEKWKPQKESGLDKFLASQTPSAQPNAAPAPKATPIRLTPEQEAEVAKLPPDKRDVARGAIDAYNQGLTDEEGLRMRLEQNGIH